MDDDDNDNYQNKILVNFSILEWNNAKDEINNIILSFQEKEKSQDKNNSNMIYKTLLEIYKNIFSKKIVFASNNDDDNKDVDIINVTTNEMDQIMNQIENEIENNNNKEKQLKNKKTKV